VDAADEWMPGEEPASAVIGGDAAVPAGSVGRDAEGERAPVKERLYGGMTVSERRSARRQRLLDAGLEHIATRGYAGTTIEAICVAAGVTARHFYEEFGSREDLLAGVFDETVAATVAEIDTTLDASSLDPAELEERVHSGLDALLRTFLGDPRRARVVCIESVGVSPAMEARRREVLRGFATILEREAGRLVSEGIARTGDATLTSRALVGGVNELIADWILTAPEHRPSVGQLVDVTTQLFMAVITYRGLPPVRTTPAPQGQPA
jgi:AcrR family transcriptional regulator